MRAVTDWINANARSISLDPGASLDDLAGLHSIVAQARVVGVGETTRAGHEVVALAHRVLRYLVEREGFRALVIQDDRSVIAELDAYIHSGHGDPRAILENAWVPWRTTETVSVLRWMREYNLAHPQDPVHLVGLGEPVARLSHYDTVTAFVAERAPQRLAELNAHLDVVRTAHDVNEHVQIAHGIHPGRPFIEHARDAREIVAAIPDLDETVGDAMNTIVDFHAHSIAAGFDFADSARNAAAGIIDYQERTGRKLMYWEGIAHTARTERAEANAMSKVFQGVGSMLDAHYGRQYASLVIGFDQGEIHAGEVVPPPAPDFADAVFAAAQLDNYLLDLRSPSDDTVAKWLAGQHKNRIIAGIYKPAEDAEHYLAGGPLDGWFDAVLRVATITPTTLLDYEPAT